MPDEPAHYNYIAHIAHGEGLPVLKMGDFDMDYIGYIVGERFPASLSVLPLRYEFYQPPLYYLSAVPVYWLAGGLEDLSPGVPYGQALVAIRLFGVGLGLVSLILIYRCLAVLFPYRPEICLAATAFAGTLPMYVAVTASVNNDTLAIMLLLASSLYLLSWMRTVIEAAQATELTPRADVADGRNRLADPSIAHQNRLLFGLGLCLGLGLLAKIYAYAFLPLCLIFVGLVSWRYRNRRQNLVNLTWVLAPALVLGLPLWLRNLPLYGILDPLGLSWHDAVVVGQPTTFEWIATHGWAAYWQRAFSFTFRSFWGVFGWLAVFWDERWYTLMRALTLSIGCGALSFFASLFMFRNDRKDTQPHPHETFLRWSLVFMISLLLTVLVSYIFYNLKFVQHQGRYLFWGILAMCTLFALGWRELMRPPVASAAALVLTGAGLYGFFAADQSLWQLVINLSVSAILLLSGLLHLPLLLAHNKRDVPSSRWGNWIPRAMVGYWLRHSVQQGCAKASRLIAMSPYLILFILSFISLFGYIIPQLQR